MYHITQHILRNLLHNIQRDNRFHFYTPDCFTHTSSRCSYTTTFLRHLLLARYFLTVFSFKRGLGAGYFLTVFLIRGLGAGYFLTVFSFLRGLGAGYLLTVFSFIRGLGAGYFLSVFLIRGLGAGYFLTVFSFIRGLGAGYFLSVFSFIRGLGANSSHWLHFCTELFLIHYTNKNCNIFSRYSERFITGSISASDPFRHDANKNLAL